MKNMDKFKPAVTKTVLIFLAGLTWACVGTMLLSLAFSWLSTVSRTTFYSFGTTGVVFALMVHHFGFLKIVDKNLDRILPMDEKKCLFAFIPWKSYLTITVMIIMGAILRHSAIPKQYLAILYTTIGLSLILSSVRYIRTFFQVKKGNSHT
ncbi:MAG: hypothetical protein PF482_21965 [Desulfobacteraceae bacterium]|jgi:uncharacterized membrane protein HdeD (DUF308 family)|nr:hypothetical protein [Desulfobacteraceae bacterium]